MTAALDSLLTILDLEQIENDIFRGTSPDEKLQRVFGGQVAGQALVAAGRTVAGDRPVHSLHAYFLRPGDPSIPIVFEVDRLRDGRSFTTRRVVAVQHGKPIFNLSASFQLQQPGVEHQVDMPQDVAAPEDLPTFAERFAPYQHELGAWYTRPRPVDMRYVGDPPRAAIDKGPQEPQSKVWIRADGTLPDDPLLHVCVATYASDMMLLDSVLLPHGLAWQAGNLTGASLDHAMWFHRPFRADDWLLYDQWSPSASGSRGLAAGRMWTRGGSLVVSVVQEGLIRRIQ
ncbi:MAG TPA: acyl-CoA thioesterase II [Frankiaceae bacterium]|nr:acyl-CoA thioesterase II [Frankiaceae bacterium]